jgi:hypothetical protein
MNKSEALVDVKVRLISDRTLRGVIVANSSRKNKEEVIVEWQDGDCSPINPVDLEEVLPSDGKLEKQFEDIATSIGLEIQDKVAQAEKLLNEACSLSDEHGIPFFTNVSLLGQPYVPEKFESKWIDLDRDFVSNITEVMAEDLERAYGWQHSQAC